MKPDTKTTATPSGNVAALVAKSSCFLDGFPRDLLLLRLLSGQVNLTTN